MKNLLLLIALITCFCLTSCENSKTHSSASGASTILKIKIINKTSNDLIKHDTTITDKSDIEKFTTQFQAFKEAHNLNVKSSFGFYDVLVYKSDGALVNYGVIYTVFDGIVIYNYNDNKMYKNDEMFNMMLHYLAI